MNIWARVGIGLVATGAASAAAAQTIAELNLVNAAQYCRASEVADLIGQGVNVDALNPAGYSSLMMASGNGCDAVVRLLLEAGADRSLRHPSFGDAAAQARMNGHGGIAALIQAETGGAPQAAAAKGAEGDPPGAARATARPAAGTDAHGWPRLGSYGEGGTVLYSGNAGKTWGRGRIRNIDPTYGYNIDGVSGSNDAYFVVATEREPFWTQWFVGDWRVSVPMATGTVTDGRSVYRTVSGGLRRPPLRIGADGRYSWRVQEGSGERLIQGRWIPNPDGPGLILKNGEHGADWLVYNNSRTGSELGETIILSADGHSHYDGSRLK